MIIDRVGLIEDGFYALGHASVPVYLMDGNHPALFDAGFTGFATLYVQAIKSVLGKREPSYLFITHAHWDHIGSVGIFKETWPEMKIVATREAREILDRPKAIETITALNRQALSVLGEWGLTSLHEGPFAPFQVDEILDPSEPFYVGEGITVTGLPSPGHTRDFAVYWIDGKRILIASEAVGCNEVPEFLVDYDVYLGDIRRFTEMNPRILCTGHMLVLTEDDAREYLRRASEIAENYREFVEALLKQGVPDEAIVRKIKQREWDKKPIPKQPLETYLMNTRQRVLVLKKRWEACSGVGKI